MITFDVSQSNPIFGWPFVSGAAIVLFVTTKKGFLAFRVSPDLKTEIQEIANSEARSISQVCELLLSEGVQAYKKEGPKFMQRLVAKQKARAKDA
jgi:hypothetical protein